MSHPLMLYPVQAWPLPTAATRLTAASTIRVSDFCRGGAIWATVTIPVPIRAKPVATKERVATDMNYPLRVLSVGLPR